jgi:hypothetical protein
MGMESEGSSRISSILAPIPSCAVLRDCVYRSWNIDSVRNRQLQHRNTGEQSVMWTIQLYQSVRQQEHFHFVGFDEGHRRHIRQQLLPRQPLHPCTMPKYIYAPEHFFYSRARTVSVEHDNVS